MNQLKSLFLFGLILSSIGCSSTSKEDIWGMQRQVHNAGSFISSSPCRPFELRGPEEYLNELGKLVLNESIVIHSEKELTENLGYDPYDTFRVYLVTSAVPNAWVYGDDFAVVTTTMFLQAKDPRELIAVLCHEFAHINSGHCSQIFTRKRDRKTIKIAGAAFGFLLDLGAAYAAAQNGQTYYNQQATATESMMVLADAAAKSMFESFGRSDELNADLEGLRIYTGLGLPAETYDDVLCRMRDLYGEKESRTHPRLTKRISALNQAVKGRRYKEVDSSSDGIAVDFVRFQNEKSRVRKYILKAAAANQLKSYEMDVAGRSLDVTIGVPSTWAAAACGPYDSEANVIYREWVRSVVGMYPEEIERINASSQGKQRP